MPIYNNFKPNSYVYAKALSEHVCVSYKNQIPITIVRPSIVVGTEVEPIAGWNDNFNGPGRFFMLLFLVTGVIFFLYSLEIVDVSMLLWMSISV